MEILGRPVQPTTYFFREPSSLTTIVKRLAPQFGDEVQIASVGCSSGEEVYGLLFLHRLGGYDYRLSVDGFDRSSLSLQRARDGIYQVGGMGADKYTSSLVARLFGITTRRMVSKRLSISADIRQGSSFEHHDIAQTPLDRQYPIILCANVLYHYLNSHGRRPLERVLDNLAHSLAAGGYLVCEGINGFCGVDREEYAQALESHPAFVARHELAIPFYDSSKGIKDPARVFQLK